MTDRRGPVRTNTAVFSTQHPISKDYPARDALALLLSHATSYPPLAALLERPATSFPCCHPAAERSEAEGSAVLNALTNLKPNNEPSLLSSRAQPRDLQFCSSPKHLNHDNPKLCTAPDATPTHFSQCHQAPDTSPSIPTHFQSSPSWQSGPPDHPAVAATPLPEWDAP